MARRSEQGNVLGYVLVGVLLVALLVGGVYFVRRAMNGDATANQPSQTEQTTQASENKNTSDEKNGTAEKNLESTLSNQSSQSQSSQQKTATTPSTDSSKSTAQTQTTTTATTPTTAGLGLPARAAPSPATSKRLTPRPCAWCGAGSPLRC